jgi:peptide/nickel transport system permease protein
MMSYRRALRGIAGIGLVLLVLMLPLAAPYDPMRMLGAPNQPPSLAHLAGTDALGRDVLSRVMAGMGQTAAAAAAAAGTALAVGIGFGLLALFGSVSAALVGSVTTAGLAIPPIILMLAVLTWLDSAPLAVGLSYSFGVASLLSSSARIERAQPHVEAARSLGGSSLHIFLRHVLPGAVPALSAYSVLVFAYSVTQLAALSFLGVTGTPGAPELGLMMAESRYTLRDAPWSAIAPVLCTIALVLGANRAAGLLGKKAR